MRIALPSPQLVEQALADWRRSYPPLDAQVTQGVAPGKALRHLGLSLWKNGETEAAAQVLAAAAALAPEDAFLWGDLAGVFYTRNMPDEALLCVETSLEYEPRQAHNWLLLAALHMTKINAAGAEKAYLRALALDETCADASFGLGLLYFEEKRFAEAAHYLALALMQDGSHHAAANACLAQSLYVIGRFKEAAAALARAIDAYPETPKLRERYALLRLLEGLIDGPVDQALASYWDAAGSGEDDLRKVTRTAFNLLNGYGYREAAIALGRLRLDWEPDDPEQLYLQAAVEGAKLDRAPDAYLKSYFNQFADDFDRQLVEVLHYGVPWELCALLDVGPAAFTRILDLGCGTGLAGPLLRPLGATLVGVDLAARMLAKAAERQLYDRLVESEATAFLGQEATPFDLIFATDVLVYFGDLRWLFAGAARSLRPGGRFAFNVETAATEDFSLLASGRFAHNPAYIAKAACADFAILTSVATTVRLEANRPVPGALFVLQRH